MPLQEWVKKKNQKLPEKSNKEPQEAQRAPFRLSRVKEPKPFEEGGDGNNQRHSEQSEGLRKMLVEEDRQEKPSRSPRLNARGGTEGRKGREEW
ncbi:hypothetical protein [Desulfoscipio geothermicus]|uniref:hypothetical protein n=1 Tax=Desulfoscipio geothermicus TaxID=39060 RepID=UPI0010423366|nr:hypothetical protein [Desulfoscipio geothermicus]